MEILGLMALVYFVLVLHDESSRWKLRCEQQRRALEAAERYVAAKMKS